MMVPRSRFGFTAVLLALVLGSTAPVSGALRAQATQIERHTYARFEALRGELLADWMVASPARRRAVAAALAAPDSMTPFDRLAAAFAGLRGVDCDDAFRYRAGVLALALPTVVDPSALGRFHVTAHAPRIVPDLAAVRFDLRLVDVEGEEMGSASIAEKTDLQSVLRFRASAPFEVEGLPDGGYGVQLQPLFGAAAPRPADLRPDAEVFVMRGFKERAEALPIAALKNDRARRVAGIYAELPEGRRDPFSRAMLFGVCWPVERAYLGEPRVADEDPFEFLPRAERVSENLREDREPLAGLSGRMTIGLPGAARDDGVDEVIVAQVELPVADDRRPRPLCVVMPAVPAWNQDGDRPLSPDTAEPGWMASRLRRVGFAADAGWHVAVLESPGRFRNPSATLRAATAHLRRLLSVGDQPTVWVGVGEASYVAARALLAEQRDGHPARVRGLVQVAGAGLAKRDVDALDDGIAVLAVTAQDHPTTDVAQRVADLVDDPSRYRTTAPDGISWLLATELAAPAIEAFIAGVVGR